MIKKLIVFAGLLLLSNMGFATYVWSVYIDGTPAGNPPPEDLKAYLVDATGKELAYVDMGMYDLVVQGRSYNLDSVKADANEINRAAKTTFVGGSIVGVDSLTQGAQAYRLSAEIQNAELSFDKELKVRLIGDQSTGGNPLEYSVKWDKEDPGKIASSFMISVPEPTSGLLVLMGLAGLALKRKKAA